jgi:hypothetical protein
MDNAVYYEAAYAAAALIYLAYTGTLWWRGRQLARRADALDRRDRAAGQGAG